MSNFYAGYYQVGNEKYSNKLFAAIHATQTNQPMKWCFYDEIFAKTKPTYVSDIKLLYRQRAYQLREKYDYLILYFSGGSDSWTVLNTFLENNIKLDHVFVKWPLRAMNKGFYIPNAIDKTAFNFVSEWDLVINKDLKWLAQNYPEIRIEVGDWLENLTESYFNDQLFADSVHHHFMTNLLRVPYGSKVEKELVAKGKKVGAIYGVDKPAIIEHKNKCYFFFKDAAVTTCPVRKENPYGTEYFYWTPDMPEIVVEQAHKIYNWYKNNADKRKIIKSPASDIEKKDWTKEQLSKNFEISANIIRSIVYPDWDFNKFQADKPLPIPSFDGKQKDYWLEIRPEMQNIKKVWKYYWQSYIDKINPIYLRSNKELEISRTMYHYIGDMQ